MYKESLFELVRQEEIVIWAGAGLSLYAGFPSGNELKEILLNNLSKPEKESINVNLPLSSLAEEFCRLKNNSRNSLIRILNKIFLNKIPLSKECHQNLALIPHFKTIITTNYDTLIEDTFGENGQFVYSVKQIPYLENGKTHIFKIHGDLKEPDSIIITDSDYNNFFKLDSENGVYWTVIKERLSTNSVLFLGYNIEDPNVSVVFDKITDELGANRKECFLVAPNLAQHKINNLTQKGIQYINSTAEELVKELINNIKENIIEDLEKGITSADTFRSFLSNIDLLPDLKGGKEKYKVHSLRGTNESVEGKMNITFKNDANFFKEFNDFALGKKIGNFEIPEDKLINADFRYGGIKFPNPSGINKLIFKSIPRITTIVDIRFEDDVELIGTPVKIYGSQNTMEIHLELKNAKLTVNFDLTKFPKTDFKFNYQHKELCNNVKEEIELFTFMLNLAKGMKFKTFAKSGETFTNAFSPMEAMRKEAEYFLNYFINLKRIEKHFGIRFSNININTISKSTYNAVTEIISAIDGQTVEYNWNEELTMDLIENYPEEAIEQLKAVNETKSPVGAFQQHEEIIELHGHEINLGYKKVEFPDSFVTNLQAIIDRKENIVRIRSHTKKMLVSYSKKKIEE